MVHSAPWFILLVIVGGLALSGVLACVMARQEKQRLADVTALATNLGFDIAASPKALAISGLSPALTSLPVFTRGHFPSVRYIVRGHTPGGELFLFDHRTTTQAGRHTATCEQTIAAFALRDARVPEFELWPENFLSKVGQVLGTTDIRFVSVPDFSRCYRLRGSDREAVTRLFEYQAAAFLSKAPGWSIQGAHRWVVFFQDGRRQKPKDMPTFLDSAQTVLRSIVAGCERPRPVKEPFAAVGPSATPGALSSAESVRDS